MDLLDCDTKRFIEPVTRYPPPPSSIILLLLPYIAVEGKPYQISGFLRKLRVLTVILKVNYRGSIPSPCTSEAIDRVFSPKNFVNFA